jgi:hypothetical protein
MASSEDRNHVILLPISTESGTEISNNFNCIEMAISTILYFTAVKELASKDGTNISSHHASDGNKQKQSRYWFERQILRESVSVLQIYWLRDDTVRVDVKANETLRGLLLAWLWPDTVDPTIRFLLSSVPASGTRIWKNSHSSIRVYLPHRD